MKTNLDYEEEVSLQEIYKNFNIDPQFWQELNNAPSDIRMEILDLVETIEMVHWMMQPVGSRKLAKDLERDKKGRIIVDITKPHILEDMDYFRQPAITYQKTGKFTNLYANPHPRSEYRKFWDEQTRRCKEGYIRESDGEWIPGYYYWYLNFSPIMVTKEEEGTTRAERVTDFPSIWDSDYQFFHYVEQGESDSLYGAVLKTRGRGYSFKVARMLDRNYYLFKKSKGFAFASESEFLTKDGILNKAWDGMDFIDEFTPWAKLRQKKDTLDHKRASYIDALGKEKGYMSEIMAVTTKGNPEKGRGKRGKLLIYEEGGLFPGLLQTWNIARPSIEDGDFTFGYQVVFGTGGTLGSKFEGLEELFYSGGGYKVKMLRNVWDKVKGEGFCGFFVPEYMNRKGCYDKDGNSNIVKALIQVLKGRKNIRENATKENALTQEKAERPCISKNTIVSNISIGSNQITLFDKHFINGHHELFELITEDGRKLECTFDHEIYNGETYKEAGKYDIGEKIKLKEFIPNKEYIHKDIQGDLHIQKYQIKIDEDFSRMLGLYMGDGCFYNNSIEFSFDEKDISSIEWLTNYFENNFKTPIVKKVKDKKMIKVIVNSIELKLIFQQLDLIEKWNGNKHGYKRKVHVPLYIFQSPKSVIAAFLQGYFDSDGSIYQSLKNIRVYAKYKIILEQVQVLLSSFGIFCKIKSQKKVNSEGRIFTGNSITLRSWEVDLFKEIGFLSNRKQELLNNWSKYKSNNSDKQYGYDTIKSFNSIGVQEVYDIQTEEGCYSANGIWAHNCTPQEAVMRIEGTLFPVDDLKGYLEHIIPNLNTFLASHYIGSLVHNTDKNKLEYFPKPDAKVIREFPLKDNVNKEGAIEIFEMPHTLGNGEVQKFRYIAGCLTPGEKVLTDSGLKQVEKVTLNDKLINKEGDLVNIQSLQIYHLEDETTYNLKVANTFRKTNFTSEHPIYVGKEKIKYPGLQKQKEGSPQRIREFNFEFKKVEEVKIKDWIQVPNIYKKVNNNFLNYWDNKDTRIDRIVDNPLENKDFWWLVGLYLGDGWIDKQNIYFALNKKETYYLEKLVDIIKKVFNREPYIRERNGVFEVSFCCKQLVDFLKENLGKYAEFKKIKEWIKYLPHDLKEHLVLGYLDSDGCVYKQGNYISTEFVSINLELLESIQDILFSLGIVSGITKLRDASENSINNVLCKTKETYHLRLASNASFELRKLFNKSENIVGKISKINDIGNVLENRVKNKCYLSDDKEYIYFQIIDIEESKYTGKVYNFACDTHTFMCHHITTHNCDPIDDDSSTTNSLASIFILDTITDRIVAEYTGRPKTANAFYETALRMLKFYNAVANYENDKKGLYAYFFHKNALTHLCDTPQILKDMDMVKAKNLFGNKLKGTNSGVKINAWGRRLQADWMVANAYADQTKLNLHKIRSIGYIKEAIGWNIDGNFDRVSAMGMLMILRQDYLKYKLQVSEEALGKKTKQLSMDSFFEINYNKGRKGVKVEGPLKHILREKSINNLKLIS